MFDVVACCLLFVVVVIIIGGGGGGGGGYCPLMLLFLLLFVRCFCQVLERMRHGLVSRVGKRNRDRRQLLRPRDQPLRLSIVSYYCGMIIVMIL